MAIDACETHWACKILKRQSLETDAKFHEIVNEKERKSMSERSGLHPRLNPSFKKHVLKAVWYLQVMGWIVEETICFFEDCIGNGYLTQVDVMPKSEMLNAMKGHAKDTMMAIDP